MGKLTYLARRLAQGLLIVAALVVLNFILIRLAPGDPASLIAGEAGEGDAKFVADLRREFGLDLPLYEQLFIYAGNVLRLDLGYSYYFRVPVWDLIVSRLPATLILTVTAYLFAVVFGVAVGLYAALKVNRWQDNVISIVVLLFYAAPAYWLGLMFVLIFSIQLDWLPPYGFENISAELDGWRHALDVGHHLILPALTLGTFFVAVYDRLMRSSVLEVSQSDFVRTARAKGATETRVIARHILRNAALSVITFAGLQAGQLIGGAVVAETVFAWPGLGRLTFDALLQRDYNLLLGILFVSSIVVVVFNIITDFVYTLVDPRIELSK